MIRPQPTAADFAKATAFIDGPYREQVSASYHAFHRESLIRQTASAEMMKRQAAEHRAKAGSQPVKMEGGVRRLQMIAAMAMLNAAGAHTYVLRDELANPMEGFEIGPRRNRSKSVRRGKKAPRRHGAKLKPNRLTISKRVRRKHRRSV